MENENEGLENASQLLNNKQDVKEPKQSKSKVGLDEEKRGLPQVNEGLHKAQKREDQFSPVTTEAQNQEDVTPIANDDDRYVRADSGIPLWMKCMLAIIFVSLVSFLFFHFTSDDGTISSDHEYGDNEERQLDCPALFFMDHTNTLGIQDFNGVKDEQNRSNNQQGVMSMTASVEPI